MKVKHKSKGKVISRRKVKPILKWQTGEYERHAEFKFILPYQFLLLCKLVDKTPNQVLGDFMDNLSCDSWKREGRDNAKSKLIEYFIEHGYGKEYFSQEELKTIFAELDAIGRLWPSTSKQKLLDLHFKWRKKYQNFWFKKWFNKNQRS